MSSKALAMYQSGNLNAYVVRIKKDREMVGIFVCRLSDLWLMTDECTDPHICEYRPIGPGCVMWPNPGVRAVPLRMSGLDDDGEQIEGWFGPDYEFGGQWMGLLGMDEASSHEWKPIHRPAGMFGEYDPGTENPVGRQ